MCRKQHMFLQEATRHKEAKADSSDKKLIKNLIRK